MYFFEEPEFHHGPPELALKTIQPGLKVVVPKLPQSVAKRDVSENLRQMIDQLLRTQSVQRYWLWYYTPMALKFTRHLSPDLVVYDVMDELGNFLHAPPELFQLERDLLARTDVVFTGGPSLFRSKKSLHPDVHLFPSSVDVAHFARARFPQVEPEDQARIPHPRLGFFGVIDERMNLPLLKEVSERMPQWHFVMIGPVVKIDEASLPNAPNIHWLGFRSYSDLPQYLAGWDVGIMPFAMNRATQFISPTKTPEMLAAGLPVISTPIADVVDPYQRLSLIRIASNADELIAQAQACLDEPKRKRLKRNDAFLKAMSWDTTWHRMSHAMTDALERRKKTLAA